MIKDLILECDTDSDVYGFMKERMKRDGRYKYRPRGIPQTPETLNKNKKSPPLAAASIKQQVPSNLECDPDAFSDGL